MNDNALLVRDTVTSAARDYAGHRPAGRRVARRPEMQSLGLEPRAELVCQAILHRLRWRTAELANALNWPEESVREVVDQLRVQGFVTDSADRPEAIRAVEPCLARPALAAKRPAAAAPRTAQLRGDAVNRLVALHERLVRRARNTREPAGLDEVGVMVERLVAGMKHDITLLVPSYVAGSYEFSTQVADAVLRQGGTLRSVWSTELLAAAPAVAHAKWLGTRVAPPRAVPQVPIHAVIVDSDIAVVIDSESGPRIVRGSALNSLRLLADHLWDEGFEVRQAAPAARADTPPLRNEVVLRLLAEGLTDDAVARRIGVSVRTVRNEVASAMVGLNARSRFQAGVRAAQLGLL